jgi:tRNA 2-selenouridine synthase
MLKTITVADALKQKDAIFVDTRTPKEFDEAHIPGAINSPILNDEERVIIGILYKQKGPDEAITKGKELFLPKVETYVKSFSKYKNKTIIVYCWRGGMRSKFITELLDQRGFNVMQMIGGHKEYRAYIRERLDNYKLKPKLIVLHGLTGTGKTEIIQKIDVPKIDLEDIAQHRSSIFGAIGLTPRTQKMFESVLLSELDKLQDKKYVLIEGESRKIGDCMMPEFLHSAMNKGMHIRIDCPLSARVKRIVDEYFDTDEKVAVGREIIKKLRMALSNAAVDELLELLDNQNYAKVTEIILLRYYDPKYSYSLDQIKYDKTIKFEFVNDAIREIKKLF